MTARETLFEARHAQRDLRWFSVWVGLTSRLMLGVVLNTADGPSLGVGVGPLYFGIGGYDR